MIVVCEECGTALETTTDAYYQSYLGWRKEGRGAAKKGELIDRYICGHHIDKPKEMIGQTDIYGGVYDGEKEEE